MTIRVLLRPPDGQPLVRDIVDLHWAEPSGDPSIVLGEGLWALPGLVDAHSHLAAAELDYRPGSIEGAVRRAREALRAGVTLVLDKGWADDTTVRVIDILDADQRPEIEAAATLIAGLEGYFPGFAREVTGDRLEQAVLEEARRGSGWVKLVGDWPRRGIGPVANFTEPQLRLAVETAASNGSRVAIHTMAREVPSMAVNAGVQSIEHGLFLTESDIDVLGARVGMWVPTFMRVEATITDLGEGSSGRRLLVEGLANAAGLLGAAVEAGVHVLAGTDLVGSPANVAAEALKLGEYGLSPVQVVEAVSSSALIATGRPGGFEVGAPADAVLFPANPIEDPGVLAHPSLVIRLGLPV